jgi:hypothetical protein
VLIDDVKIATVDRFAGIPAPIELGLAPLILDILILPVVIESELMVPVL